MINNLNKHIARVWNVAVGALITLGTIGCASGPPQSGFLSDYESFEEAPADAPIWAYVTPHGQPRELDAKIWRDKRNAAALAQYGKIIRALV